MVKGLTSIGTESDFDDAFDTFRQWYPQEPDASIVGRICILRLGGGLFYPTSKRLKMMTETILRYEQRLGRDVRLPKDIIEHGEQY